MSIAVENYIKTIYKQNQVVGGDSKLGTLASLLNISNAAATDMARKLALKKLVVYTKYKPLVLTVKGEKLALAVIRKHRLWETFLHQTLGLNLHEIHQEAELLEHLTSDFLAQKIDDYLGNPSFDPHGDPIPNYSGVLMRKIDCVSLSEAKPGKHYEVCRLFSSDKDFFDFCKSNDLSIGSRILLIKQYEQSRMTEIIIDDRKLLLNNELSSVIYVK